jgi:hypothetical protein
MRAILLPNGNRLILAEAEDPELDRPEGVSAITPDHPEFGTWLAFAEAGEDSRRLPPY